MADKWILVDQEVLDIAGEIISEHLPELDGSSIAFMFRDKAPNSNGKVTMGQAKKVSGEWQALGLDYDFFIWLAQDIWYSLTEAQKRALVHHELMHCGYSGEGEDQKPTMIPHDMEEFNAIIRLYGFWWPTAQRTVEAVQAALPMMEIKRQPARVEALDPARLR